MKARSTAFGVAFATLAIPAAAAGADGPDKVIQLPSGAELRWLETVHDNSGGSGLTYRFRFLMTDLAKRVPSTTGPASEPGLDGEDSADRGPIEIDTESGAVEGDDGMIDAEQLNLTPVEGDEAAEVEADSMIDEPALPAAPDVLAQDPLHDDVVWLCQNWVLPHLASPDPRPQVIMISIADKDIPFGAYDPEVLQLFEAFRLPADRDECEWEPW